MKDMKRGTAAGGDKVTAEMLKMAEDTAFKCITEIANKFYHTGNLIEQMRTSVFVSMPKSSGNRSGTILEQSVSCGK